jgi:chorismate mutase
MLHGIRGATVVEADQSESILQATRELLEDILQANPSLRPADIASAIFTVTPDLHSAYPARAARDIGWQDVPMLCAQEIPVPNGLPLCIRVLIHWNTELPSQMVRHVYLHQAASLRPDLASG